MLSLFFVLLLTLVALTVVIWLGTFFFQGYIYTKPSQQLYWQAPAAALLLTIGYGIWCYAVALSSEANPTHIPINALHRFSPRVDMLSKPAPTLWAITLEQKKSATPNKESEPVKYKSVRDDQVHFHYEEDKPVGRRPWQPNGVIAIEIVQKDGAKLRFDKIPVEKYGYHEFVSKDGWTMMEDETGPSGLPTKFSKGLFLLNMFFNFGHLFCWFAGLWLLLRFQWLHALAFAAAMWLVMTLVVVPMLLDQAATVAAARHAKTAWLAAHLTWV